MGFLSSWYLMQFVIRDSAAGDGFDIQSLRRIPLVIKPKCGLDSFFETKDSLMRSSPPHKS